jgi:hypothetical protein
VQVISFRSEGMARYRILAGTVCEPILWVGGVMQISRNLRRTYHVVEEVDMMVRVRRKPGMVIPARAVLCMFALMEC